MKRIFALLAVLCLLLGCLAGCSSTLEEEEDRESEKDDGGKKSSISGAFDEDDEKESEKEDDSQKEDDPQEDDEEKADPTNPGIILPTEPPVEPVQPVIGNFAVPSVGYDGSEVTIKFAHTMGAKLQAVLDYHIGEFNKLYPNIHIEHNAYGGWSDIAGMINTEIIGGTQPNIAYCYPDHVATYNKSMTTVTLDELIKSNVTVTRADGSTEILGLTQQQIDDLVAGGYYYEGMVYGDGLMYTLPMSKSTEVLYYNKTFFEANGISVPTTWEEMEAVCRQIKQIDPSCIPLGCDSEDNLFINLCEQYGCDYTSATGEHYLFNNDGCKSFTKMLNRWYQSGYMTTEELYGGYTSSLFTETDKSFDHCYMCIASTGGASYQLPENGAFEVGVAPIPQADPSDPKVICQGPALCLLKGGSNHETVASWLFMKYLATNLSFQAEFSMTSGYMPVIASVQQNPYYSSWLQNANGYKNLSALVVKVGQQQSYSYFTAPAFVGSSAARTQVGKLLVQCMLERNLDSKIDSLFQNAYDELKYRY